MNTLNFFFTMLLFTLPAIILLLTQIEAQEVKNVKVHVYYETLCPDSQRFVKHQLLPLLKNGGDQHIDIEFIPYGKATTSRRGSNYSFNCQHGKAECEGNKMHACAIKYLSKSETIDFVGCSMGKSYPPNTLSQCASEVGINASTQDLISTCARSVEGDELLAAHGETTQSLRPKLFFVPTITYDNIFEKEKMWQSQNDFEGVVCGELKNSPDFCVSRN